MAQEIKSLMMVTYNRLPLTKQTVDNIYDRTQDFEFVIVDNGSTDGTVDYLQDLAKNNPNIHLIINTKNKGIAIGRNQALKKAVDIGTNWFCTIDNDVLLPENWLDNCIDILKANKNYAMIGVNFEDVDYPIVELNGYTFQSKPKGNLGTACIVFNATLHKMIGYFNTEYSRFYGLEDSDAGMRVRVLGFKMGYIKDRGIHLGVNEHDTGAYREFKTKEHQDNLAKFNENCAAYVQRKKPIYIPYRD